MASMLLDPRTIASPDFDSMLVTRKWVAQPFRHDCAQSSSPRRLPPKLNGVLRMHCSRRSGILLETLFTNARMSPHESTPASVAQRWVSQRAWATRQLFRLGWRHAAGTTAQARARDMLPLVRSLGVLRRADRLFENGLFRRHAGGPNAADPLYALRHRQHLARDLPMTARLACTIDHYEFDEGHCDAEYQRSVYLGAGVELWSTEVAGRRYAIVLRDSHRHRHEGALSVALVQGDHTLHVLSFSWVRPASLGLVSTQPWTMLICRNQSSRMDFEPMRRFRQDFPQNATGYFCMAAALGLAQAHDHRLVAAVGHAQQIAYRADLASGFRHSYCDFWTQYGGVGDGTSFWSIPVEIQLSALEQVAQKHRARAQMRRAHWSQIGSSARSRMRALIVPEPRIGYPRSALEQPAGHPRLRRATVAAWLATMVDLAPTLPI